MDKKYLKLKDLQAAELSSFKALEMAIKIWEIEGSEYEKRTGIPELIAIINFASIELISLCEPLLRDINKTKYTA